MMNLDYIQNCSYTEFVGLVNQTNVPPGAYATLTKWRVNGFVGPQSNVLEVACTTGFSLREMALATGCRGLGFDLSDPSVERASESARKVKTLGDRVSYVVANGYDYAPSETFTHVILGAALGFFPDERRMLERCTSFLGERGTILASPFYVHQQIPQALLHRARQVLGIYPTNRVYKDVMTAYRGLRVAYEDHNLIQKETPEELQHYCESTVKRAVQQHKLSDRPGLAQAMYDRLYEIKDLCNELRPYQGYSVLVLQYERNEFPNRYVELF